MARWTLTVTFDTLATIQADGMSGVVVGEDGDFIREIVRLWGLDRDELNEIITWDKTTVTVQADVLDYLVDVIRWVIMTTIPQHMELTRNEDRN